MFRKIFWIQKVPECDMTNGLIKCSNACFSSPLICIVFVANSDGLCCVLSQPCPRQYTPPVQFRDIEANRRSLEFICELGNGSFGMVYRARFNKTFDVAVKKRLATTDRALFIEEARVMHRLHHRRIVRLLGVCTEPADEPVFIITELMEKGALRNFLASGEGRELGLSDLIDMIAQVYWNILECI